MNLYKDFKPVSHQEWLDKITQDLKGKDFSETLVWKTDEDINVQPFYNAESLKDNLSQSFNLTSNATDWEIREQIEIKTIKDANQLALNALKSGANSIQFNGNINSLNEMNELLSNIMLEIIHIHFYTSKPTQTLEFLKLYLIENKIDKSLINCSISYDYLGELLISGSWNNDEEKDFKELLAIQNKLGNNALTIRGDYYTNAGATIIQEIVYTLSQAIEYIDQLTELGISPEKLIRSINFHLGINSNYFFEIAKIRAFRILWQIITETYGVNNANAYIHSQTAYYNIAAQDAQTNILRTTTEGMSAILGGCNSLSITPFNFAYENPNDFTLRIARNIQIILKEEAYLNKVNDTAKGSYYIEHLTDELVTKSLALFKEIEAKDGFLANIKNGVIQNSVKATNLKNLKKYQEGKKTLLGVNKYPNDMEKDEHHFIQTQKIKGNEVGVLEQVNLSEKIKESTTTNA